MINQKTTYLKLPLPSVDNELEDDCPRLEEAFKKLDAHAAAGDARLENVETQAGNLEQRAASNEGALGTLEGRASVLESKLGETSATLQAHGTALHNCDAALRDHAEGLIDLSNNKASKEELEVIESSVTAISTTLIGSVLSITAAEGYVPNGTVPADAAEYTREQFREFYDTYLEGGKLLTCTYAAFAAQVALTGNCAKFALDKDAQKFKVPLVKNGDSITQAASASELGKSVKAGLPNITGNTLGFQAITGAYGAGALYSTGSGGIGFGTTSGGGWNSIGIDANRSNPTYRNDVSTVITEQVRLRHFVVLASAQNSASVFDWSNYMAGLAGKANLDMDNLTAAGAAKIAGYGKPSGRSISMTFPAYGNFSAPAPASGFVKAGGSSTAAGQWLRISKMPGYTSDDLRYSSIAGQWLVVTIPVRKGDTVFVDGNVPNSLALTFIYDVGAD